MSREKEKDPRELAALEMETAKNLEQTLDEFSRELSIETRIPTVDIKNWLTRMDADTAELLKKIPFVGEILMGAAHTLSSRISKKESNPPSAFLTATETTVDDLLTVDVHHPLVTKKDFMALRGAILLLRHNEPEISLEQKVRATLAISLMEQEKTTGIPMDPVLKEKIKAALPPDIQNGWEENTPLFEEMRQAAKKEEVHLHFSKDQLREIAPERLKSESLKLMKEGMPWTEVEDTAARIMSEKMSKGQEDADLDREEIEPEAEETFKVLAAMEDPLILATHALRGIPPNPSKEPGKDS